MIDRVLAECQVGLPGWRGLGTDAFDFAPPKGFSTFTMAVRAKRPLSPPAVLYRRLAGKDNAILDVGAERVVFLALAEAGIAPRCLHYEPGFRLEAFYEGATLVAEDLYDPATLRGVAEQLYRFHHMAPPPLPAASFFELLHARWAPLARHVLVDRRDAFPANERVLCEPLTALFSEATRRKVAAFLPEGPLHFCHNDSYHGNVMRLADGGIRLLDFEFSCLNHRAFDFANLFAETVMVHGLTEPPHFRIAAPRFTDAELEILIGAYLDHGSFPSASAQEQELQTLVQQTRRALPLSDYMYAMAALPLALEPVQRIRFLPYAHQRFERFLAARP